MKKTNLFNTFYYIAFLSCLFFLFTGCGEKPDPQQKKVFSQKIVDEKTQTSESVIPSEASPKPPFPEVSKELNQLPTEVKELKLTKEVDSAIDKNQSSKPAMPPTIAHGTEEPPPFPATGYTYNPKGKIDPFQPWLSGVMDTSESGSQKRLPLTPLEKVDLSQLKLVGVVLSPSGNKALVEETSGKGFVITPGTYVGTNGGKVVEIYKDKVIIEEMVTYGTSGTSVRKRELNLQKPPGED